MSETTKTPRAHAEMAARFMADDSLNCWQWDSSAARWELRQHPYWHKDLIFHVGHEKPTAPPKRKVTIAGITFDAPETDELALGAEYWLVQLGTKSACLQLWNDDQYDHRWLANGLIHLDMENASLHAEALRELNRQMCGLGDVQ